MRADPDVARVSGSAPVDPAPGRWLAERARRTPHAPAIAWRDEVVDYAELDRRAAALARDLASAGVGRGDVVATSFDNGPEGPVLLWALHALGAVLLPLNRRASAPELAHALTDSGAVLLAHGEGEAAAQAGLAASEVAGLPLARVDAAAELVSCGAVTSRTRPVDPLLVGAMALLYTSGTTGRPKGAVLGAEAFLASARASESLLGTGPADRWLACMPLFHVGGLSILIRACLAGSLALVHERFDPVRVDRALDRDGVTGVSLVAHMLERLLDVRGARRSPGALRCVLLGGGPTPEPLLERARAIGLPVAPTYGLTEAASQVATRWPVDDASPRGGRMRALPGTALRILDDRGRPVAAGVPGEIAVRSDSLMRGYLGQPEASAKALRDGWLHTGDVGVLDEDGRLGVLDRRDDLIISGGENIYPAEIEAVLLRHPAVAEAAVIGVEDARYGARPAAFWVPVDPAAAEPDLAAHCRAALAAFKLPVAFARVPSLPRSASGKLLRRELRRLAPPPAR